MREGQVQDLPNTVTCLLSGYPTVRYRLCFLSEETCHPSHPGLPRHCVCLGECGSCVVYHGTPREKMVLSMLPADVAKYLPVDVSTTKGAVVLNTLGVVVLASIVARILMRRSLSAPAPRVGGRPL